MLCSVVVHYLRGSANPSASRKDAAMRVQEARSAGEGLERSCQGAVAGWLASTKPAEGVELFRAWFAGEAYRKHRHDTYAIGITDSGVQVFDYRGAARASTPGQVVVLYPDEAHDGRAGTDAGFGYRIVYVEPALLAEALRGLRGRPGPLPFVSEPVSTNATLSRAVDAAFRAPLDSLAVDALVMELARGLMGGEQGAAKPAISRRVDVQAVERARQLLEAEKTRVVHSRELESVTGLTRYDLARQFRIALGTSPYRYLLMRRLSLARERIHEGRPLAEVALDAGFADQAHMTRAFRSAFGLTPAQYRALGAYGHSRRGDTLAGPPSRRSRR
jgi:AraC-like DNA-binding protein